MRKKTSVVKNQKTQVRKTNRSYWDWVSKNNRVNKDGELQESVLANPDELKEEATEVFQRGINSKRCWKLYEQAIRDLPERQRDAWKMYYRENMSEETIGEFLEISQQSVSELLRRAYDNIVTFCESRGLNFAKLNESNY